MILIEQLSAMHPNEYAIIVNYDKTYDKCRSGRMRIGNVDMERLRNIWNKDVYSISYSEDKHCYVICIGDKAKVKLHLAGYKVIDTRLKQLGLLNDKGFVKVK